MEQNQNTSLFQLNLDAQNSYTLRSAASWAKVLGICGLILGILFVILGIMVQAAISRYESLDYGYRYRSSGMSMGTLGNIGMAFYIVVGLVFVITSIFAINAGNKINGGLRTNDQATLNAGFAGVRNYFAFWAIIIIILLLLILLGVAGNL
ncbi:MAG: hypothetical protein IPP93_16525 [Chitinophagaceae bacterium]|nr:hypothetical protein [Chitinophagaceae bacterium]MBL0333969.1 hypothetical protein [Chitinophagaceae bacterium]